MQQDKTALRMGQKPADAGVSRYGVGCAHARRRTALRDAAAGGISGGLSWQVILCKRRTSAAHSTALTRIKLRRNGEDKAGAAEGCGHRALRRKIEAAVINGALFF